MNKRYTRSLSLGLLAALAALACILSACPTGNENSTPTTKSFTVTFNVDGGSAVPSQTVEEGKTVTEPTNPTKSDHTFANWYRDTDKKNLWNFKTDVVVQDMTLYAKWVQGENVPSFKVTFDADGGTPAPAELNVLKDEPVTKPTNPTKSGFIFDGWYTGTGTDETKWDFTKQVTTAITLKAKWIQAVTVTFETNGGSTIAAETVAKGTGLYPSNYTPTKAGHVFDGWYTDKELTKPAGNSLTVNTNTTLYAKWISTSTLAPYAGVWRNQNRSYWLQEDGTAWTFYSSGSFSKDTWSTSLIDGRAVAFDEEKTSFTMSNEGNPFTKNTTDKKTPAAATGGLLGTWASGSQTVELKADKTAVFTAYGDSITLNYCAEASAVYLLTPTGNLVIFSISISDGKLDEFSKPASDSALAGIWKLTEDGQDYYWTLDKDGKGTFHTLGVSVSVSFTVTENKKIDGDSYTISGDTLTLPEVVWDEEAGEYIGRTLTKVSSVPTGSGADGDSRLHGTWEMTQGSYSATLTFNADGTLVQKQGELSYSSIWKADGNYIYIYSSSFSSKRISYVYTVSGSTFTLGDDSASTELTKQ